MAARAVAAGAVAGRPDLAVAVFDADWALLTVAGTLPVLFFRSAPRRVMDAMMGFAAGVMVAASCWSLLVPAIASAGVLPAVTGLLLGAALLWACYTVAMRRGRCRHRRLGCLAVATW